MSLTSLHFACHNVGGLSEALCPLKVELTFEHVLQTADLYCVCNTLLDHLGRK